MEKLRYIFISHKATKSQNCYCQKLNKIEVFYNYPNVRCVKNINELL